MLSIRLEFLTHSSRRLMILEMKDPFIRELRRTYAKAKYFEGMRSSGSLHSIGGRYVEDAFVYRIR